MFVYSFIHVVFHNCNDSRSSLILALTSIKSSLYFAVGTMTQRHIQQSNRNIAQCVLYTEPRNFLHVPILFLLVFTTTISSIGHSSSINEETEETLEKNAYALKMFVDELPYMPLIKGYSQTHDGKYLPANLTIGMYMKLWVCSISFSFLTHGEKTII